MKKLLLLTALFVAPLSAFAQDAKEEEGPKDGWHKAGNISLLFSQAAFNHEWTGGGTNNYAANLGLAYDFNYKKEKFVWDNRIMADYGITKTGGQDFTRKTNDRLEFNSLAGKRIKESLWYASAFFNFKTQFTSGYTYFENMAGEQDRTEKTKFLSPGYFQGGPGLLWKKSDNLKVNIAPATARVIVVASEFTNVGTDPMAIADFNMNPYFGVEANATTRFEFGASLAAYAKLNLMENITMENILSLFSNYLEDPQNVDIDYTLNFIMSVNKWITANAIFQAIYDDNAAKGFQIREGLGIGVTYGF